MTPRLAHARRGERAFERLYRRHVGDVYRYALVLLRDPRAAEEVTRTTFLNAYRAHRRGERAPNTHAWLLALAHAICRQRFRAAFPEAAPDDDAALRAVPDEEGPSAAQIRRALARLPFDLRAALAMRELEGRPYSEIAEVLALPAGEVEAVVFRARRALREQLEGTLTCHQAERAVSRQVDGMLPRSDRRLLRAHLRECDECARFARSQRAQRSAWKALAAIPLPASLQSFFGSDGVMAATVGSATVGAVATAVAIAVVAVSAAAFGYDGSDDPSLRNAQPAVEQEALPGALAAAAAVQPRRARPHPTRSAPRRARVATTARAEPAATRARAPRTAGPTDARAGTPRVVHVPVAPAPTTTAPAQAQTPPRVDPGRVSPPPSTSVQTPAELVPPFPPVPPLPLPLPLDPPQPPQLP